MLSYTVAWLAIQCLYGSWGSRNLKQLTNNHSCSNTVLSDKFELHKFPLNIIFKFVAFLLPVNNSLPVSLIFLPSNTSQIKFTFEYLPHRIKLQFGLSPLTPMSDQDRISPYNINKISTRQVMKIKKNVYFGIINWSNTKFSELKL